MIVNKTRRSQHGASALEALFAVPVTLVACLLVLQIMLLYRAKITLNFATQEAARIGAMNNGRVVPRFLTDVTQFQAVLRQKKKCTTTANTVVEPARSGNCPTNSTEERVSNAGPPITSHQAAASGNDDNGEGESKSDDRNSMRRQRTTSAAEQPATGGDTTAPTPAAVPSAAASTTTNGKSSAATKFFRGLGRGMMRYGDSSVLQGFIIGIAPLYTKGSANDSKATKFSNAAKGQYYAYGDALMHSCIIYHNPTHAAFIDFGFVEIDGPNKFTWQIPNDLLRYRIPGYMDRAGKGIGYYKAEKKYLSEEDSRLRGKLSKMSVQDATLLSIEIKYSYALEVPIARNILIGLAKLTGGLFNTETALGNSFNAFSLEHGRWPMSSFATYRMQTPVHWHPFYPFGDILLTSAASNLPDTKGLELVKLLYDKVREKVNTDFDHSVPQAGFCPGLTLGIGSTPGWMSDADKSNGSAGGGSLEEGSLNWVGKDYDTHK